MKLQVLHDQNGRIIAAVQLDDTKTIGMGIVPKAGHSVADVEVPTEHTNTPLTDLVKQLRVDVQSKQLVSQ